MTEFIGLLVICGIIAFLVLKAVKSDVNSQNRKKIQEEKQKSELEAFRAEIATQITPTVTYSYNYRQPNSLDTSNDRDLEFIADTANKKICFADIANKKYDILNFQNIIECRIQTDKNASTGDGIGGAVLGGLIAGDAGAVAGANIASSKKVVESLQIHIVTSDIVHPLFVFNIVSAPTRPSDKNYSDVMTFTQNIYATIKSIMHNNKLENKV